MHNSGPDYSSACIWPRHNRYTQSASPLLEQLLRFGSKKSVVNGFDLRGWAMGGTTFGPALLRYIVAQALGVRRHARERVLDAHRKTLECFLDSDEAEQLPNAIAEARRLHAFTQEQLREQGPTVTIIRALRDEQEYRNNLNRMRHYARWILRQSVAARCLDYSSIPVEMDLLSSFNLAPYCDYNYHNWKAYIRITVTIPIEDIFLVSDFIRDNEGTPISEGGEYIYINRAPDGIVQIPTQNVCVTEKSLDLNEKELLLFQDRDRCLRAWADLCSPYASTYCKSL